jgi:hypothetical protein
MMGITRDGDTDHCFRVISFMVIWFKKCKTLRRSIEYVDFIRYQR